MPTPLLPEQWQTELSARRVSAWKIAQHSDCDLILVFGSSGHFEPFRYLTNFVPVLGDAWAIITALDKVSCVLNFTWQLTEARGISGISDWYGYFDPIPTVVELLSGTHPKRIGVVGLHRLPVTAFDAIKAALPATHFVNIGAELALLRRQKTDLEIQLLREACRITDYAFDSIRAEIRPGLSEVEVAARLTYLIQSQEAKLSFEPTVISGNDDPIAIRMPTSRLLQKGDSVMIDIGAEYQGYQADATRTFVLGEPNNLQKQVWSIITEAYQAVFDHIRPGIPIIEPHQAAVKIVESAGYQRLHRFGHGIGLATSFEWPSMDTETSPQIVGMTFCIEPGIYAAGAGNMKLEDDVLVTATGYELLTHSSSELIVPV